MRRIFWAASAAVLVACVLGFSAGAAAASSCPTAADAAAEAETEPGVQWSGCNLDGFVLGPVELAESQLEEAGLLGTNLEPADLHGASLQAASATGADLKGANLKEAVLQSTFLEGADLEGANLEGADLIGADLKGANLSGASGSAETLWVGATCADGKSSTAHISSSCLLGIPGPPEAAVEAPAGGGVYRQAEVVATKFSCKEGASGPGLEFCTDSNGSSNGTGQLVTAAAGEYEYRVTVKSKDGQLSSASIKYRAAAPPEAKIEAPATNSYFAVGQSVATKFSCQDSKYGSGIESCGGQPGSTGTGKLNTSAVGEFTYAVTAVSKDHQEGTAHITYTVYNPLSAGTTSCNGLYGGTGSEVTVANGATCRLVPGTTVTHNVHVSQGGSLIDEASLIEGNLQANNPVGIQVGSVAARQPTVIDGSVQITGLTGSIKGAPNLVCDATIAQSLEVQAATSSAAPIVIGGLPCSKGDKVGHDLTVQNNATNVNVSYLTGEHDVTVQSNTAGTTVAYDTSSYDFTAQKNSGPVIVAHNTSGHNLTAQNNTPGLLVEANKASASLQAQASSGTVKPVAESLPVISGEAKDEQPLTATEGGWLGTATITYSYQWQSCNGNGEACSNIPNATSSTYAIAHEQVGHTIRVKVTAKNTAGEASETSLPTAVVIPSPPLNFTLPQISGEATDEQTLTATSGVWGGTPPLTYLYEWQLCNAPGEEQACTSIPGATGPSYTLIHEDVGRTIRVVVTAVNVVTEATTNSLTTAKIAPAPPVNTEGPRIYGIAEDERTLTSRPGSWRGTPPFSYGYQWEKCNTEGNACEPITGANQSSYMIGHAEVHHTIRVLVTAKNAAGEATGPPSAATAPVRPSPPHHPKPLPSISGQAIGEQELTANPGGWRGTPEITYTYQWELCGGAEAGEELGGECEPIENATEKAFTLESEDDRLTVRVKVTASNEAGAATLTTAATALIVPSALEIEESVPSAEEAAEFEEGGGEMQPEFPAGFCEGTPAECELEEAPPEEGEDFPNEHLGIADGSWMAERQPDAKEKAEGIGPHGHFNYFKETPYFNALHVKLVRRVVPWNMVSEAEHNEEVPEDNGGAANLLADVEEWINLVRGSGAEPEIAFGDECFSSNTPWARPEPFGIVEGKITTVPEEKKCEELASASDYERAVHEFLEPSVPTHCGQPGGCSDHSTLRKVRYFEALNEPNKLGPNEDGGNLHPTYLAQPTKKDKTSGAQRAGEYWRALNLVCAGRIAKEEEARIAAGLPKPAKPSCEVAAGDFLDTFMEDALAEDKYEKEHEKLEGVAEGGWAYFHWYVKGMKDPEAAHQWAWHAYTEGGRTAKYRGEPKKWWPRFKHFESAVDRTDANAKYRYPAIWLTEQGVEYFRESKPGVFVEGGHGIWPKKIGEHEVAAKEIIQAFVDRPKGSQYQLTNVCPNRPHCQITEFFYYAMLGDPKFDSGLLEAEKLPPGYQRQRPAKLPREIYNIYKHATTTKTR